MSENARIYLSLSGPTGPIEGESRVSTREGWIEIHDWDWKLEPKAEGDDAATVVPSVFSFSKTLDRASSAMLTAMKSGSPLLAIVRMEDATLDMFALSLQFERVRFIEYTLKTEISDKRQAVMEDWEFDYEAMTISYRPNLASGTMKAQLQRPVGSAIVSAKGKLKPFMELTRDMSLPDIDSLVEELKDKRRELEPPPAPKGRNTTPG